VFSSLHSDFGLKQPVTFITSLCLQVGVLVVLCSIPQKYGPALHRDAERSTSITPIYFQKDAAPSPSVPESEAVASNRAPEISHEEKPAAQQEGNSQPEATDDSAGKDEGQTLAPFASWSMNSMPNGMTVFHHQIKTALPVFTPDPPILHGEFPEVARGKDVILEVVIDDQGSIVRADVLQAVGYGVENSIMETLRRWIFVPAKVNGVAIASRRQLRFHFPG
jgi:TonB family protein